MAHQMNPERSAYALFAVNRYLVYCASYLEWNVIKLVRCISRRLRAGFFDSLNKPDRASHMAEYQEAFVIIQHLVVMRKALLM